MSRRRVFGRRGGGRGVARIDVTNFIDVVLILLIFLVATSSFVSESSVPIDRPRSERAEQGSLAYVTVAVTSSGAVHCSGRAVALEALTDEVARAMRDRGATRVIVQADRSAPVGLTLSVMDRCTDGGAGRVDLAAALPGGDVR